MFRKYEKTYHIFPVTHKYNLEATDIKRLLGGDVIVEEKMDGANAGIIRHHKGFHLQKRNSLVGPSVHEQFDFFYNWANVQNYSKIMAVPEDTLIYGELLYAVHTIYYDHLPDYFLVFDVRQDGRWFNYAERVAFCAQYGFHMVPLITMGHFELKDLHSLVPTKSAHGDTAEGIVIKRYAKHGYFRGKLVRPEFIKTLEESEHWTKYNCKRNRVVV